MTIMADFFDIKFLHWNYAPECKAWVSKHFDYYVLDFAAGGALDFSLGDSTRLTLNAPVAWLTFPGPHFQFGKRTGDSGSWEHRYVAFRGAFAEEMVRKGIFNRESPVIPISNPTRFKMAFDELLRYLDAPAWGMDRGANMLEGLLLQLHEQEQESLFEQMDGRIRNLVVKIRRNPGENWNFRQEAKKIMLSNSHFRKLFHDGMNQSPTLFLIGTRMEFAARLLKETLLSISEIAERCGYDDFYYFSKSFKKYHSTSPGRYRRQAMIFR